MNEPPKKEGSLIELMIATAVALLLILSVSGIYFSNKLTYHGQNALSRLSENTQFIGAVLARELRMAGYQGCANPSKVTLKNWIAHPNPAFDHIHAVQGYKGRSDGFSPTLSAAIAGNPILNSDVLSIHVAGDNIMYLNQDMQNSHAPIVLKNTLKIPENTILLMTNCAAADLFVASSESNKDMITHTKPENTASTLSIAYPKGSEIFPYHYYAYYVRDTGRVNSNQQPIYALVREDAYHHLDEIAIGVEKMHITYALDMDADHSVDLYQTAAQIDSENNWDRVIGLQISLLITTIENATLVPESYYFDGATITPTDNRLRRTLNLFIFLRIPGVAS